MAGIEEVRNSNGKRVCDISADKRVVVISLKGCITRITANPDGTLRIENDFDEFTKRSDLIIANRIEDELTSVTDKVYTRDLFARD